MTTTRCRQLPYLHAVYRSQAKWTLPSAKIQMASALLSSAHGGMGCRSENP